MAEDKLVEADLFLTHFHWDHIQGLPFFEPARKASARIRIHAPIQGSLSPAELLVVQMQEAFFPVAFGELPGIEEVLTMSEAAWTRGLITVDALKVCHPSETVGYRVRSGGATLVYIPDNELAPMHVGTGQLQYRELLAFCAGADLLVHDAMYTAEEYPARAGWGHSTFQEAISLAEDAGVRSLRLFHHAPERSDAELDSLVRQLREELADRGSTLDIDAATEGQQVRLTPPNGQC